jgi:hypothetical protein
MGRIWGYPDTGLGKPFVSVFLVIYHSMRLSLEGVLDIQNSVEIMRLLDRHTRTEIKITTQRKRLFDRHTKPEVFEIDDVASRSTMPCGWATRHVCCMCDKLLLAVWQACDAWATFSPRAR